MYLHVLCVYFGLRRHKQVCGCVSYISACKGTYWLAVVCGLPGATLSALSILRCRQGGLALSSGSWLPQDEASNSSVAPT